MCIRKVSNDVKETIYHLLHLLHLLLTIHLPLIREYDFPPATGRVDGQGLLEALFNLRGPNSLGVSSRHLLVVIKLAGVVLGDLLTQFPGQAPRHPHCICAVHGVAQGLGRPRILVWVQLGAGLGGPGWRKALIERS